MEKASAENRLKELWEKIFQKFCMDYINVFSDMDVEGWLNHFVPNKNINIFQYGKDATGKKGKGKTIKIYTGNLFSSLIKGRISAKIMAKLVFKRLVKQNYSHSEMELLGIQKNIKKENETSALFRYKRFNTSGKIYESGIGLYFLSKIENKWLINGMSVYDDNDELASKVDLSEMWHPDK